MGSTEIIIDALEVELDYLLCSKAHGEAPRIRRAGARAIRLHYIVGACCDKLKGYRTRIPDRHECDKLMGYGRGEGGR